MSETTHMQQTVYQVNPDMASTLRSMRDQAQKSVHQNMNRRVRVQTMDGQIFDGTIVHSDGKHVYLSVQQPMDMKRGFFPPFYGGFNNVIIPLVLYELLVITLLV